MSTSIEWCDETWNPVRGCARVSPGCENCYAERQAHRFSGPNQPYNGLTVAGKHGPRWSGRARFEPSMLWAPYRWCRPRRVFVNSMSDLFHEDISDLQIAAVFGVMAWATQHTYIVLTKRPERMQRLLSKLTEDECYWAACCVTENAGVEDPKDTRAGELARKKGQKKFRDAWEACESYEGWPLPHVWIGVSCEDQTRANERIPALLETPAAVRFVSAEPLLGPIDLRRLGGESARRDALSAHGSKKLDWVIVGGESGTGARLCDTEWISSVADQCMDAGVACFIKQLGTRSTAGTFKDRRGSQPGDWPVRLRVRQFPYPHHDRTASSTGAS